MNRRNVRLSLYKKELFSIFRDKKTLLIMLLIPLIVYPCTMLGSIMLSSFLMTQSQTQTYMVSVYASDECKDEAVNLKEILVNSKEKYDYHFLVNIKNTRDEAIADVDDLTSDASVCISKEDNKLIYSVSFFSSTTKSSTAYSMIEEVLGDYEHDLVENEIREVIPDYDSMKNKLEVLGEDHSTKEETAGMLIGMIIPFMLLTSVMVGCLTPAIDVTAGERERGTLETMMTLPVKNVDLMISKFLAVSTVAVFSALLNLISMGAMFIVLYSSMASMLEAELGAINLASFIPTLLILAIIIPLYACLCSLCYLSICLSAKTFKEANNLCSPAMIVIMFASMVEIIPNISLGYVTALIPVCNVSLLIRDIFTLKFEWDLIFLVFASNIIYLVIGIYIMSTLFNSENVLFGDGIKGLKLFEKRANMKNGQIPGIGDLFLMFAILFIVMVYSSNLALSKLGIWGTAICQLMILLVPCLYAWYMKADLKKLFSLKMPGIVKFAGGILLFVGAFLIENVVMVYLAEIFPSMNETASSLNDMIKSAGLIPALFVVGFTPAIAEEAAFRGFLFGTLKEKYPKKIWIGIIVSAVVFGLYHMNLLQFFGACIIGSAMAYMVYKSESILTSSVVHCLNNSFSVICTFYPEFMSKKIPIFFKERFSVSDVLLLLGAGLMLCTLGVFLLNVKERVKKS